MPPVYHNSPRSDTFIYGRPLRQETEGSTATWGETFERLEKDVADIDTKIIDLQTIPASYNAREIAAALTYVRSCQDLLRALLLADRKLFDAESADDRYKEADREFEHALDHPGTDEWDLTKGPFLDAMDDCAKK